MSIKIFNKLPDHIMDSRENKRSFISRLKQYLVNKSLYSLEEFMNDKITVVDQEEHGLRQYKLIHNEDLTIQIGK
jgi:hypothetical protein